MDELIKFVAEKLMSAVKYSGGQALALFNHLHLGLRSSGGEVVAWFHKTFPPETWAAAADKIGYWFDKIFPPETRAELSHWIRAGKPYIIAAVILVVAFRLFGGGGGMGKMMKAPGRNYYMPRSVFESDPKGYFSDLRRYH